MENFHLSDMIEFLVFIAALIGIYVKMQVKMKELEMKLIALEAKVAGVEHQDEKIMNKLEQMDETISEKLFDIKLELQTKQNKQS